MNNSEFYSSFQFDSMGFHEEHNTDMRLGSPMNFLALMKKGMARIETEIDTIEYKHYIQCENAKALLRQTDYDIETVSELLSFSSSSYFRKVFFKVTGKTPSQIRRERGMI